MKARDVGVRDPGRAAPLRDVAVIGMEAGRVDDLELAEKGEQLARAWRQGLGEARPPGGRRWPMRDAHGPSPRREQPRGGCAGRYAANDERVDENVGPVRS